MYVSRHIVTSLYNSEPCPGLDELCEIIGDNIPQWSEDTVFTKCDITGEYSECYRLESLIETMIEEEVEE